MIPLTIEPLTKHRLPDYLALFDHMVFKDNPEWSICYCYDYHFTGDVATCTRESNRAAISDMIRDGRHTGYLAYHNGQVIGWCNANDRSNYARLLKDYDHVDDPNAVVCSVVCFIVHAEYRRQGVAQQLLEHLIRELDGSHFHYIEAYPKSGESSNEGNFKGPLALYQRLGFTIHRSHEDYHVMRKYLTA